MKYEKLFSPIEVKGVTFRNRVVMEPHQTGLATPTEKGAVCSDASLAFYKTRSEGGVGLIVTELACVESVTGLQSVKSIRADDDYSIEEFKKMAVAIHSGGARGFVQINHPGSEANKTLVLPENFVSSSRVLSHRGGIYTRPLEKEEIYAIADKYGEAALRVKLGGMDGVAIHGAHHYLIHQFLSANINKRTDEFGGCLENRARFLHLVLDAIKEKCGEAFPIMLRLSAEEYVGKHGQHIDEVLKVCQMCEQWDVAILDISASGSWSHGSQSVEPPSFDQGWRKHLAKAVKKCVKIPVSTVSLVRDPEFAESLLENNYCDFVGSARSFIADPNWVKKAQSGREADIMHCISCMRCYESISVNSGAIRCSVNPEAGYEAETKTAEQNGANRKVAVIGGGPAGLEAAVVLAQRKFAVTVFEKMPYLGGQVYLGSRSTSKHKNMWLINTLEKRCQELGVTVICDCSPSVERLKSEEYYAVVDATGGVPLIPPFIKGAAESKIVFTPPEVLRKQVDFNDRSVAVIGSGFTGLEVAETLSERNKGNGVYVIEMSKYIAPDGNGSLRNDIVDVLIRNQVMFMLNRKCTEITDEGVYMESTVDGEKFFLPCDAIVLSIGVKSCDPFNGELEKNFERVYRIGDEAKPARIKEAVRSGYEIAMTLE